MREKMQRENCAGDLTVYHCIIHQEALCGKALDMDHVISTVTQTVNVVRARGLNHRQFQSFLEEMHSEHGDIPYHTEVRWLSRGIVLNRFFELREEICTFGKDTTDLRDEKCRYELAFLCDTTKHLNALNLQLQGQGRVVTDMYDAVRVFQTKLRLWETQMQQGNFGHFPCCQALSSDVSTAVLPTAHFAAKLSALGTEFKRRFADFAAQRCKFELLV